MTIYHCNMRSCFDYQKVHVLYMSYVLQLSTHISLDFIIFSRYPVVNDHTPEPSIRKKITNCLIMVFGQTQAHWGIDCFSYFLAFQTIECSKME